MNKNFINAKEVAEQLGVSTATAYRIMTRLNAELESKGYIVIRGKTSRVYFMEKIYGGTQNAGINRENSGE